MKLLLTAQALEVFYGFAVLDMTPEYVGLLVDRSRRLREMKKTESEIFQFRYWDSTPTYYEGDASDLTEKTESSRMECALLNIDDDSVEWQAIPKHTDSRVYTESIRVAVLEQLIRDRAEYWLGPDLQNDVSNSLIHCSNCGLPIIPPLQQWGGGGHVYCPNCWDERLR